jgi:hypothetical protein
VRYAQATGSKLQSAADKERKIGGVRRPWRIRPNWGAPMIREKLSRLYPDVLTPQQAASRF